MKWIQWLDSGLSDSLPQPNTNPNLNLGIYSIKFQFCTLTSSNDNRQLMIYQKMYLELNVWAKALGI